MLHLFYMLRLDVSKDMLISNFHGKTDSGKRKFVWTWCPSTIFFKRYN